MALRQTRPRVRLLHGEKTDVPVHYRVYFQHPRDGQLTSSIFQRREEALEAAAHMLGAVRVEELKGMLDESSSHM